MPQDISAIAELALESVSRQPIPGLVPEKETILATTRAIVSGPPHFCWVSEIDGHIEGAVAAEVSDSFWFRGKQASVLLFYCRRGGEGGLLLRKFARWVKARPAIKVALFSLEGEEPRLEAFLRRLGFAQFNPQLSWVRG